MANRVAVVGVGQTRHKSKHKDVSIAGLVRQAAERALADAGCEWQDIDALVLGKAPDMFEGMTMPELYLTDALGGNGKPFDYGNDFAYQDVNVQLGASNPIDVQVWNKGSCGIPGGTAYTVCLGWSEPTGAVPYPLPSANLIECRAETVPPKVLSVRANTHPSVVSASSSVSRSSP